VTGAVLTSLIALPLVLGHAAANRVEPSYRLEPVNQSNNPIGISQQYRLAKNGDANSQLAIGTRYLELQNSAKALYWFEKSALQGNAEAQMHLGDAYARGKGVPVDLVTALMWLNLAAAHGGYEAKFRFQYVSAQMTAEQITKAQRLAHEWKKRKK